MLHLLQAGIEDLRQQLEAAIGAERFDEADALQSELDNCNAEADSLAADYHLSSADMRDLLHVAPSAPMSARHASVSAHSVLRADSVDYQLGAVQATDGIMVCRMGTHAGDRVGLCSPP